MHKKILLGLALALISLKSLAACDVYIRSVPFTVTQDNKTYCVQHKNGTGFNLLFDPYRVPDQDAQLDAKTVKAAIVVDANNVVVKFMSAIWQEKKFSSVANKISVGVYIKGGDMARSVTLENPRIGFTEVGVYAPRVGELTVNRGWLYGIGYSGIRVDGANSLTVYRADIEEMRLNKGGKFSLLSGIVATIAPQGSATLTENTMVDYLKDAPAEWSDSEGILVKAGDSTNINITHNLVSRIKTSSIDIGMSTGIKVDQHDAGSSNISVTVSNNYVGDGRINKAGFGVGVLINIDKGVATIMRNTTVRWNDAIETSHSEFLFGTFGNNDATIYWNRETETVPGFWDVFNIGPNIDRWSFSNSQQVIFQ